MSRATTNLLSLEDAVTAVVDKVITIDSADMTSAIAEHAEPEFDALVDALMAGPIKRHPDYIRQACASNEGFLRVGIALGRRLAGGR